MGDRGTVSALYPIFYLLSPPAKAVGSTANAVPCESAKQIGMSARAFQTQMMRRSGIYQNPIGFDVEITGSHKLPMKRVVFVGRWERRRFD
jgi:hypothetical protein